MAFTKENAGEYARQAVAARTQKRTKSPQEIFDAAQAKLAGQLVDAAMGRGDFAELPAKERLQATIKALEFGIGRPTQQKPQEAKKHVATPEDLFASS